ncbi:hypothetical protein ACFYTF_29065 [Nocardia thailandica]|uniref:DUF3040 domain-containing protein n=1 Tax=Nocardia thailandica TaxID=257275 RepID=A0ABW6PWT2_9NOCA
MSDPLNLQDLSTGGKAMDGQSRATSLPEKPERPAWSWLADLAALALIATTVIILVTIGGAGAAVLTAASGFVVAAFAGWRRNRQ